MGKVIVTNGNRAKIPYLLKNSKLKIYSVEELVYCILKNPELCEDFLYDRELAAYMDSELGLKERASLLADCIERESPLRDIVTIVFCSCDYLERDEIDEFVEELSKGDRTEKWVRIKNKADSYLQHENYKNAVINYRNLIKDSELLGITTETLGDIYHDMGVATLRTEGFAAAADCFREGYERNSREETLKAYLLALRYSGKDDELRQAMEIYGISDETNLWLNTAFFHTGLEAESEPELLELSDAVKDLKAGKVGAFYLTVNRMLENMKEQYRKYNE